jgi:hypothetical protein
MTKAISTGKCHVCSGGFPKSAMTRHLNSCLGQVAMAGAQPARKASLRTFHLLVEGRHSPEFWLHLGVPAAATLENLDRFLRAIWLECCGHMSAFTIAGVRYSVSPIREPMFGGPTEKGMKKKLYDVLSPGLTFEHEYDFGTPTVLKLKVVAQRERVGGLTDIVVLARNDPPPIVCEACGQPATRVCSQCLWNAPAWFCDKCAGDHECGEEMFLPVVNSPRVGTCGYSG